MSRQVFIQMTETDRSATATNSGIGIFLNTHVIVMTAKHLLRSSVILNTVLSCTL